MYNCYKKEKDGTLTLTEITKELKDAFKFNVTRAFIKVLASDTQEEFEINEENYLKNIDFDDCRYVEGEGIIGTTVAKEISGSFINVDNSFDIENRELEYYLGAELNDEMYYLKLGTFIVQKPENDNVQDNTKFEALDYMVKFNVPFKDRLQYPCTMQQLLLDICSQAGVKCGTTNFRNSTFKIDSNQFVGGESCRDVLKAIAQMAFSWARINEENELLLDFELTDEISEEITNDEYITLEFNKKYGPVNTIILKNSQVEGENITIKDDVSISKNGSTELIISDNPFAYSQSKRSELIDAGINLYGFNYTPLVVKTIGCPYLDCKNKIRIKNMQGEHFDTYIFNNKISYGGTITDIKESIAMTETETKYQYTGTLKASLKRTELIVNKHDQEIKGVISDIGDRSQKTTTLTEDIDGLKADVEQIAVLTKTVEGFGKIKLDNTSLTEIQEFKISGNVIIPTLSDDEYGTYGTTPMETLAPMSNLAPTKPHKKSEALYFSDETLLKDLTLIHIKSDNTIEKILLPDFILRTYYDTKDEFVISDGNSKLIQRVGVDDAGFLYSLKEPIITELGEIHLLLTEGDETFYLEGFGEVNFSATYMIKNDLVNSFATKVELKSSLELTSQIFNVELSKKVDDKELTGANIALRLNEDDSEATIKADKISLEGTVTANENFKVLEDGSIETKNGSFSGDIYLADGSNIVGGKGLYSNLQFISSNQFEKIGYQADEMNTRNLKQSIKIQCNIPENFTIEKAFITLFHRPMALGNVNNIVDYGYARNIRLYTNENYEYSVSTEYYGSEFWEEEAYYLQEISGAFGSNGYTPSVPSASSLKLETKTTTDISKDLKTGLNEFVIQTANSIPSYIDGGLDLGYPNWLNVMKQTGGARAILFVYGYMKVK